MFRGLIIFLAVVPAIYGNVLFTRVPMLDGRIVGGVNTTIESHPHQVSVRILGSHSCGGSILKARVVVTAAHCVSPSLPSSSYAIQYGSTNVNGGKTVKAVRHIRHPSYNANTIDYDVALIFLAEDIVLGSNAKPIALASKDPAGGSRSVVSGWGATKEGGSSPSVLQKVDVLIVDRSVCAKQYSGVNNITERMLCAGVVGVGGKDACQGDSGGPLVVNGQLSGIVSWGVGCARPDYAGVYTNVASVRSWINENA